MACVRSGISGWVIGLLIGWRAGAERRAANSWSPWSPMLADGEARRCFLFGTWRSAVAELFGNSRSQQLAAGQPSDVLARCWILASAERDRSLNLLGKGAAFTFCGAFPRAREGGTPRPAVSIRRRRRAAMGTVRREPIETAGRGVAVACVCSGISGWVIGLLIGWRAVAERRAANSWSPWSPMLADVEARRCFLFGTWRSAVAELFANRRSQQLAAGQPSDVLARCWILASAERDRSLNLLGKEAAFSFAARFLVRARAAPSASGFDPAAPARSYGDCSARADRNRWPRGGCGVCVLRHFRLGDRALDRLACGRRTARGQFLVALVADAGRRRGPPLFSVWDLEIGGGGALRQPPLATAGRRAAFGCARTLLDFGIGRARPLLESARKGSRVFLCGAFPRAREGGTPRPAVSIRRRRRAAMGTVRREPIETAGRGVAVACVCSGISGWVIGLLIGWRAVAERRAANSWSPWSPMLADVEARRCFLFGTWRSAVAELFANRRSQQLAAGQPSDVLARCWILASAERDRSLNLLGKEAAFTFGGAFPRAREGGPLGQRFRSGGAGAQLWGLFGASRSKPLAEGWLWRVCAPAFQAG